MGSFLLVALLGLFSFDHAGAVSTQQDLLASQGMMLESMQHFFAHLNSALLGTEFAMDTNPKRSPQWQGNRQNSRSSTLQRSPSAADGTALPQMSQTGPFLPILLRQMLTVFPIQVLGYQESCLALTPKHPKKEFDCTLLVSFNSTR